MTWEDRVIGAVDDAEVVQLCRDLVAIPSYTGEEEAAAQWASGRLREFGFDVELQEVEPGRSNVVADFGGEQREFMFNGHLDIDPLPDTYDLPMFQAWQSGAQLIGTGLGNMKAGLASMIGAAAAIRRSGCRIRRRITILLVVGELAGGTGTFAFIKRNPLPSTAIVPEPTGGTIRTVHAGCLQVGISIKSRGTSQGVDRLTEGALAAMDALERTRWSGSAHPLLADLPRFCVGGIASGVARPELRVLDDECVILIDVRSRPDQDAADIERDLASALGPTFAGSDLTLTLELPPIPHERYGANALFQPPLDLSLTDPLVSELARWHERIGGEPATVGFDDPGSYASADSGWLFSAGVRCVNYGPAVAVPFHDRVDLDRLAVTTRVLAVVAAGMAS